LNIELLREHCVAQKAVTEEFPFGEDTLVFKVAGKMFALISLANPTSVNLKCDPENVEIYRQQYSGVLPGFHMNKKHWNTVLFNADVKDQVLLQMVTDSYRLVVSGLPKTLRETITGKSVK
jgi:predicted DNA-binding protein (MmcQ/YjbR family)